MAGCGGDREESSKVDPQGHRLLGTEGGKSLDTIKGARQASSETLTF